jgi:hypothetical protein
MSEATAEPVGDVEVEQTSTEAIDTQEPATAQREEGQAQPVTGQHGFPSNTPVADMAPEEREAYWRYHAQKHERRHLDALGFKSKAEIDAMREAARKYAEYEDSQKSEQQKLMERLEAAERERDEERRIRARMVAAATYDLPEGLMNLVTGSSEEEINESAKALAGEIEAVIAARLAVAPPPPPAPEPAPAALASTRPVESLRPGAMPANDRPTDGNDWLRGFVSGHS